MYHSYLGWLRYQVLRKVGIKRRISHLCWLTVNPEQSTAFTKRVNENFYEL